MELRTSQSYVVMPFAFQEGASFDYSLSVYLHQPSSSSSATPVAAAVAFSADTLALLPPGA